MLNRKPIGANQKAIANWEATNRMTIEMFKAFWQRVSPDLEFPGTQAGDEGSHAEWTNEYGEKCYGTRKLGGGQKHGIVRTIWDDNFINEATFYEDEMHGLSFYWTNYNTWAFYAAIYDHGEKKAAIWWRDDWSEYRSAGDKELILMNNGLSIFKP